MNLADMLSYADIGQLSRIAQNYQCECSSHSKNELIQSILTAVNRQGEFEQSLQSLSMPDIRFWNTLLFDKRNAFSVEELTARARAAAFDAENENVNPRDIIMKFKQRGWLFNGHSHETKYLLQVPEDVKDKFSEALGRRLRSRLRPAEAPSVYREEFLLFLDDIRRFLEIVYHEEIPLTAEGVMYKRSIQQILKKLSVEEPLVQNRGWRFGYGRKFRDYPDRFSLIYDYCYFQHYISEQEHELRLTEVGEELVLAGKKNDLLGVYRFWLRLYKNAVPNIQSIVHWVERLAPDWVSLQSLNMVLCEFIRPFYYDQPDSILERRILQMLLHLGLLRIGEEAGIGKVVMITRLGKAVIRGTYVKDDDRIDLSL